MPIISSKQIPKLEGVNPLCNAKKYAKPVAMAFATSLDSKRIQPTCSLSPTKLKTVIGSFRLEEPTNFTIHHPVSKPLRHSQALIYTERQEYFY